MEPKPFQKPRPPIWFGANQPVALRRAVRHGDGFFGAGSTTTVRFAEQVQIVRAAPADMGRDAASFRIAKRVYIALDDDADRAQQQEAGVRGLREVANAGAELILFTPFVNQSEQMERLAAEVIPQLS